MERKRRFQTRQQYAEHKAKETKFEKVDKRLNYLIAIVALLIVATLVFIISRDPASTNEALQDEPNEDIATNPSSEEDDQVATDDGENKQSDEDENAEIPPEESNQETTAENNRITPSSDPAVQEVITNANWKSYPTAQTGEHVSTFKKGHIDYEEKLKAIFSVLDIQQENSIVDSVNNNGTAKNAIAVVTSKDKKKKYRVSIEWIENEGCKPIQVEVLKTVEGI